jgi:hypothetical protein
MYVSRTAPHPGIGTGISEASKRVPIFLYDVRGGKQVSSYFRQRNWVQAREAQIRFPTHTRMMMIFLLVLKLETRRKQPLLRSI